ncbi:hypothetical protein FACS189413_14730 [Bacteroidia bacterium]|nr:hypothetical protein FACS189413_14730 [Bacteroidia bacterium]
MRKLLILLLFFYCTKSISQIQPSVYIGVGLGANLGGLAGIGAEIKYDFFSLNVAVGNILGNDLLDLDTRDITNKFGYDLGVKLYSKMGVFAGINYGLIGAERYSKGGQEDLFFEKNYAFSFTAGYRRILYKHIYGSVYAGLTSKKERNLVQVLDTKVFMPRLGLLIGYEF